MFSGLINPIFFYIVKQKQIMIGNKSIIIILAALLLYIRVDTTAQRANRYMITDYGAVADGQTLNTSAIQSAIDLCASKESGTIVVPEGIFLSGAIFLKQGVNLHIEKDGILKGTVNPDHYPQVSTRWEGVECEWTSALVNAFDMTGMHLSGEGTIDGSGDEWMNRYPRYSKELQVPGQ